MDEKTIQTFKAISNLLTDLRTFFKNDKPLALYNRLVQKTPLLNEDSIKNHIQIFEKFIDLYGADIIYERELPEDVTIKYVDNEGVEDPEIYISIGKFMKKAPQREKVLIQGHLLTVCAIISPDDKTLEKLDGLDEKLKAFNIDTSTKSGEFIHDILQQAQTATEGVEINSPADAITAIMSSGLLQNMLTGITQKTQEGGLDLQELMGTMITSISSLTQQGPRVRELSE